MKEKKQISRRGFVGSLAAVPLAGKIVSGMSNSAPVAGTNGIEICVFSKHLQWLDYPEMAATAAEIGFDGIDLTVRPKGHVDPDRVSSDLPKAVKAIQQAGLKLPTMATGINNPEDEKTKEILSLASDFGIRFYRMGYYRYQDSESIENTLAKTSIQLRKLSDINQKYGITADYQNHAGKNYFGASIWDFWHASRTVDPQYVGMQFDLRHASVEGAMNWPVDFRLVADRCHTLVIKDYKWESVKGEARLVNCPLGDGVADFPNFFTILKSINWKGPMICTSNILSVVQIREEGKSAVSRML